MRRHQSLRVAFLSRYDRSRASSRVRVYDYLPLLQRIGWECRILPFPKHLSLVLKARYVLQSLWLARWADVVVLQKLLLRSEFVDGLKRVNAALVFDFDDALYAPPDLVADDEKVQARHRVREERLQYVFREVRCITTGSNELASYAKQFATSVYIMPSSVDTERYSLKEARGGSDMVVLGWIGSPENLVDFQPIRSALRKVFHKLDGEVALTIVSTHPLSLDGVHARFERWTSDREVEFLHGFDVGLMPLNDTRRSRGRCAYKAIQYMAVGLPVIASPVGAATEVVEHAKTGFLASAPEEWVAYMIELAKDKELRIRLGHAGRAKVERHYCIQSNARMLSGILEEAVIR